MKWQTDQQEYQKQGIQSYNQERKSFEPTNDKQHDHRPLTTEEKR
jgi:hypothetical protein